MNKSDIINSALLRGEHVFSKEYSVVFDALSYSLDAGGKRVRPLLTLMFSEACGGSVESALPLACAVEYIHTYSLIHDDLPCMDNDDYRRGKPSCHKQFGESYALLAGDALLTLAFEAVADGAQRGLYTSETAVNASKVLARGAGYNGMIGGQTVDLLLEGKSAGIDELRLMDSLKTGALIKTACVLGCLAGEADGEHICAAERYADDIGLAFQIIDDILDVTSTTETLGKAVGSDESNEKSTYVKLLGLDRCRAYVKELTADAVAALEVFKGAGSELSEFAEKLAERDR